MTTTGVFQDVIEARVRALFEKSNEEQSSELYYGELGLVDYEPDVPNEQMNDISGPDKGKITIEGQEYGANKKYRGYPVTLTLRKYTFVLSWTEEETHWSMKQSSSKRRTELNSASVGAVNALQQNINEDTAKIFYLGFGTTFLNVGNSESLFGSHTIRKDGSAQLNTFASGGTHLALGNTALDSAIAKMNRFKGHNGTQLKKVKNMKLLVATELISTANQLLYSMYGPLNANLGESKVAPSALGRRMIKVIAVEVPDIPVAYSTYWFMCEDFRASTRAFMAWGWKPRMQRDDLVSKGTLRLTGSTMFGPFVLGWQWAFGSKGDGSAV